MTTLKDWIEKCANGEEIEGVVLGEMGWGDYGSEEVKDYEKCPKGTVMTWSEVIPWISYEFDDGYGAHGCQAITAWTKNRVIGVSQYDGSTSPFWMPRNPIDHTPNMPGG